MVIEHRRDEKLIYTMKRETVVTREIMHVKRTLFFFFFTNEDQRTTINLVAETS